MKTLLIATMLVGLTPCLNAVEDTPENRARLADRCISVFPLEDYWAAIQKKVDALPQEKRDKAQSVLQHVNWKAVAKAIRELLIETYTADEIQALADAYTSPVGKSIWRKQGSYLSTEELRAAGDFFRSSIGQSILRKQSTYNSKLQSILKKELTKAVVKMAEEKRGSKSIQ